MNNFKKRTKSLLLEIQDNIKNVKNANNGNNQEIKQVKLSFLLI